MPELWDMYAHPAEKGTDEENDERYGDHIANERRYTYLVQSNTRHSYTGYIPTMGKMVGYISVHYCHLPYY